MSWIIGYDFGMHRTGVFLSLVFFVLILVIVLYVRAIGVNSPYLRACYERDQRNCARD